MSKDDVLISKNGIRHDGRKREDLREIKFEVGVLDRADGSALITWGKNKILAAVYGPRELHPKHMAMPDKALIRTEYRMATFSVPDRKSPAPKRREKEISKILAEALQPAVFDYLYPRSVIDVYIQILQADGGTRCAAITVASLALADAGVPMKDLVVGCAAGNLEEQVVLDLDDVEDKYGQGDLPMAYLPLTKEFVLLQSDGTFTTKQYKEALDMLVPACEKVHKLQREALTGKYAIITETLDDDGDDKKKKADEKKSTKKETSAKKEAPKKESKTSEKKTEDKKVADKKAEDKKKKTAKKKSAKKASDDKSKEVSKK